MKKRYIVLIFVILFGFIFWFLMKDASAPTTNVPTQGTDVLAPEVPPAQKDDLIVLDYPRPGAQVNSPLIIKGKARGNWYFEATFPVVLTDWDGRIIAEGYATANGDWMTTEYVPFTATLTYTLPEDITSRNGYLILQKSNASGEPQFDNVLEINVKI